MALVCMLMLSMAQAKSLESHARIVAKVRSYALGQARQALPGAQLRVKVSELDKRLSLPRCSSALQTFRNDSMRVTGNTVVGVRCQGRQPWTVFVPVQVDARIGIVVVTRSLPRSASLGASDLKLESRDVAGLPYGYYTQLSQVVGHVLKQQVRPSQALSPALLRRPILVHRGQTVSIVSSLAGVNVSTLGVALGDASLGDLVKVRNTRSKRVVEGVASAAGRVEIQQ